MIQFYHKHFLIKYINKYNFNVMNVLECTETA